MKHFHNTSKNIKYVIVSIMLVTAITLSSAYAYKTDSENRVNSLNVGNVECSLVGGEYKLNEDILPSEIVVKEPKIQNDGTLSAFVVLEVSVPLLNNDFLETTDAGYSTMKGTDTTEAFELRNQNGETVSKTVAPNSGWIYLGKSTGSAKDKTNSKYYFGYSTVLNGKTKSKTDCTGTSPISYVRMKNYIYQGDSSSSTTSPFVNLSASMRFTSYSIQADGLTSKDINTAFNVLKNIRGFSLDS